MKKSMHLAQWFVFILLIIVQVHELKAADVARYRGSWTSHSTGHSGPMQATLRKQADGSYKAFFVGRFAKIIPFAYRSTLQPTGYGNYVASKQLGPFLGEYRMQSSITSSRFQANFEAAGDVGTFQMTRQR